MEIKGLRDRSNPRDAFNPQSAGRLEDLARRRLRPEEGHKTDCFPDRPRPTIPYQSDCFPDRPTQPTIPYQTDCFPDRPTTPDRLPNIPYHTDCFPDRSPQIEDLVSGLGANFGV